MVTDADTPVVVSASVVPHPDSREIEMVERKGRGHPDSICDALAEAFSINLTRVYHERCGAVLHHNVDKVLLVAGSSAPRFGGGEVTTPFDVYLAGRATSEVDGAMIPIAEIAEQASRTWLRANLHALDPEPHVLIHTLVRPGSAALSALVAREQGPWVVANDSLDTTTSTVSATRGRRASSFVYLAASTRRGVLGVPCAARDRTSASPFRYGFPRAISAS